MDSPSAPSGTTTSLSAAGITVRFGGLVALADVSIDVPPGTIIGLVGPNGAGKSTLFGVLSGLLRPASGRVFIGGKDVTSANAQSRARLGLARTFQQPELFMGLSVRDHLVLGHRVHYERRRFWSDLVSFRAIFPPTKFETERVDELLELLGLTRIANTPVAVLPLGLSRLVEVGRALATCPTVVLLDEPLSGLDYRATENLTAAFERVVASSEDGLSLLMVEHDVASVLALSSEIFVLDFGQLIAQGTPTEIRANAAVRAAYLGDEDGASEGHGAPPAPAPS
jgi:ABC-type branched-subunit amino acid transport system ATPase component